MQVKGQDIVETEILTMDETDSKERRRFLKSLHSLGNAIEGNPKPADCEPEVEQANLDAALRALIGDTGVAELEAAKAKSAALAAAALERHAARWEQRNRNKLIPGSA